MILRCRSFAYILLLVLSLPVQAEKLVVDIQEAFLKSKPQLAEKLKNVLLSTGIEMDILSLPNQRGLVMFEQKRIHMETTRTTVAVASIPDLIQIQPKITEYHGLLVTHTPEYCHLDAEELSKKSIAGLLGVPSFAKLAYPRFATHEEVASMEQIVQMIASKRVDFTVWAGDEIRKLMADRQLPIVICDDKPFISVPIYSFIHKDYAWAVPKIEAAYKKAFSE